MITTQNLPSDIAHVKPIPALLASVRDELRARRDKRAAHKQLARELSTYTTTAELDDLYAMLSRYDDDQVAEVRNILDHHRAA